MKFGNFNSLEPSGPVMGLHLYESKAMTNSLFLWKASYVRQCHSSVNTAISSHLQNLKHEKDKRLAIETSIFARL